MSKNNSDLKSAKEPTRTPVKKLCFCAICIALSAVTVMLKIFTFPFGGAITLFSMLFVVLPGWFYGVKYGTICGLAFGLLQFAFAPYMISIPQFVLDYVLAFSVMGIAGIFRNSKNGLLKGYIAAVIGRWVIATLAGLAWIAAGYQAWKGWNPIPYSMAYNGAYIFAEAAMTVVVILAPPVKKALERVKAQSQ